MTGRTSQRARSIPTWYGKQKFRSQLEARTAALLDHLGLFWEFEPQGYDLPSGKYLPDFRVTVNQNVSFWIEVKGPIPNAREFSVATDMNLYVAPLLILQGDTPRTRMGGTAWIFAIDQGNDGKPIAEWYMTTPERALAGALLGSHYQGEPETLPHFEDACHGAWHAEYAREQRASTGRGKGNS